MSGNEHWSRQYEQDLEALRTRVMAMGGLVESQLKQALDGLYSGDTQMLEQAIAADARVNQMEREIDEDCAHIIAKRQPTAGDLRMILGASKIVTDLERIGDKARKVARLARSLNNGQRLDSVWKIDIKRLGERAAALLSRALDAFARSDVNAAIDVIRQNQSVGRESAAIESALIKAMMEQPQSVTTVLDMMAVTRSFDRVGDHSTNVCEQLIYILKGTDVRHATLEQIEREAVR
jgi:phosphate transport system protein